jgi:hypothetical protein
VPLLYSGSVTVTRSSAEATWLRDDGGQPIHYQAELSEDGTSWGPTTSFASGPYSISNLAPGKNYWLRLRGINLVGQSANDMVLTFTTIELDLPRNLTVIGRGVNAINLTWQNPAGDPELVDDYEIAYSTNGTSWTTFSDGVSTSTFASVTSLDAWQAYFFKVASRSNGQVGSFTAATGAVSPAQVPIIGELLFQTEPSSIATFIIYIDDGGLAAECSFTASSSGYKTKTSGYIASNTYKFTGLVANRSYEITANCKNQVGLAAQPLMSSVRTKPLYEFRKSLVPYIIVKPVMGKVIGFKLGDIGVDSVKQTYNWKINGAAVKGNTSSSFRIPPGTKGKKLTVTITLKKLDYKDLVVTSVPIKITA